MEASSSSVSKFDAKKIKWSLTKFQFQFELSLAQLSPSLLKIFSKKILYFSFDASPYTAILENYEYLRSEGPLRTLSHLN